MTTPRFLEQFGGYSPDVGSSNHWYWFVERLQEAWNNAKEKMGFESTELSGRAIRALYEDPNPLTLSGKTIITAEAAERYGISDLDGYEPKSSGIYGGPHPAFDQ